MSSDDRVRTVDRESERRRFTVTGEGGDKGVLYYECDGDKLYLIHTDVRGSLRGQGVAGQLITAALDFARSEELTVVPWCPFARRWLREHVDAVQGIHVDFDARLPDGLGG